MLKELTEYYSPEDILHRDEQIKKISQVFINFRKFGVASNILIQGVTGSGKTTVITHIIKEFTKEKNGIIFVSGAETQTAFKTLKAIFDLNFSTIERVLTEGVRKLKSHPQIIVVDEVNKIKDCNTLFDNLNTIYRGTQCPIILITNKRTLVDDMPDDARLTLLFDKIHFPSYDVSEIKDILVDRLERMEKCPEIPEEAIAYISAHAGRQGSARVALLITMKCILSNNYSQEYVSEMIKHLEREDWKIFTKGLIPTERRFLDSLLSISDKKQFMRHSDLTQYLKDLSPSRISQLVTAFEDYGLLITEYRNMGRGQGRYRVIRFVSAETKDKIEEVLYPKSK